MLEGSFPAIWVQGEISNLAQPASGHIYFSIKDEFSQVRCAMFQNRRRLLKFMPENGMSVLIRANVSLYENRGEYQLIVDHMEPAGEGALQQAFTELKQRLFKEGLFDVHHKKPVPAMATRIGIITSPTGAALRDILTVLKRRFPLAQIIIYPTLVQGEGAAEQLIRMLKIAERREECEVLILARGGGSLEDLWAFNNEKLARSIFACTIPLVTGIGHEIDFTIADFVADQRAPTPSAAAELVSPDQQKLKLLLGQRQNALNRQLSTMLDGRRQHLRHLIRRLPEPRRLLQQLAQRVDDLTMRGRRAQKAMLDQRKNLLAQSRALLAGYNPRRLLNEKAGRCRQLDQSLCRLIRTQLRNVSEQLRHLAHNLDTVNPLATLNRGYAIVQHRDGSIIRNSNQLSIGERIQARFGSGNADCTVDTITPGKKNPQ